MEPSQLPQTILAKPYSWLLPSQLTLTLSRLFAVAENRIEAWLRRPAVREFFLGSQWVVTAFVASRLVIYGIIELTRVIMVHAAWWHPGGLTSVLSQWDGELWYVQIARHGYHVASGDHHAHGFFPLYPILIKLTSLFYRNMVIAALLVSHVCLLLAGCFLNALVRLDYKDPRVSRAAVMLFMFNPVSFFFSSAYSESTFFLFAVMALYAARKGSWLPASLCGMCLAASRPPGVLIAIPLGLEYIRGWYSDDRTWRGLLSPRVLVLALVPLGLGLYMLYEHYEFNDFFAFSHSALTYGRSFTSPLNTLRFLNSYPTFYYILFGGTLVLNIILLLGGLLLRLRFSYLAFAAALLFIYLCSATFEAFPRYVSVEFPLFIVLGLIAAKYRWSYEPLFACSIVLLSLLTLMSANGYWMT